MSEFVPNGSAVVVNWACPPMIAAVPNTAAPFKNCTEPLAVEGVTVAVRVTAWPIADVERSTVIAVLADALFTDCGTALEVAVR